CGPTTPSPRPLAPNRSPSRSRATTSNPASSPCLGRRATPLHRRRPIFLARDRGRPGRGARTGCRGEGAAAARPQPPRSRARRRCTSSMRSATRAASSSLASKSRSSAARRRARARSPLAKRHAPGSSPAALPSRPERTRTTTHCRSTAQARASSSTVSVCSSTTIPVRTRSSAMSGSSGRARIEGHLAGHRLVELARALGVCGRQHHPQFKVQRAGRIAGYAASLQPPLAPRLRARRHLHADRARWRRHVDLGAERRLPGGDRDGLVDVPAVHPVALVRGEANLEVEVARRAPADAGASLAGQADVLALDDAAGYGDLQRAFLPDDPAVLVEPRPAQGDRARGPLVDVREIDHHARVMVAAAHAVAAGAGAARRPAEQAGEELAELLGPQVVEGAARELEAGAPVRGRPELLAGASRL